MKVKEGILVHASKILDPEFQVVNQNKSKVMMPASFLNNQSAGTVYNRTEQAGETRLHPAGCNLLNL